MNIDFILDNLDSKKRVQNLDDLKFRRVTRKQITVRDKHYTDLLSHFVVVTRLRNWVKEFFKWAFLLMIISCTIAFTRCIFLLFEKYIEVDNIQNIIDSNPLLMTSIIGFVSAIISIPTIITKYLFSTDEDKYITDIILHTQDHDTTGREWATGKDVQDDTPYNIGDRKTVSGD